MATQISVIRKFRIANARTPEARSALVREACRDIKVTLARVGADRPEPIPASAPTSIAFVTGGAGLGTTVAYVSDPAHADRMLEDFELSLRESV